MTQRQKITTFLWFDGKAEQAARFYTQIFRDSGVDDIHRATIDTPGAAKDAVLLVEFHLAGQRYLAMNGGPHAQFNDAISLSVDCADQAEVDHYWEALTAAGGSPVMCGWLRDRYGLRWQIVPRRLTELLSDPDRAKASRVMQAMVEMIKIDVAALEAVARG